MAAVTPGNDLAEHITTVIWIASIIIGVLFAICGVLIGLLWKDLKGSVNGIKEEAVKFSEWLDKTREQGGRLVTEKLHFEWCKEQQANCQACESYRLLMDWRRIMEDKGGIMLKPEHATLCKEVTDHFCKRLDEMLDTNQKLFSKEMQLVAKEFQLLRTEIKNNKT